VKRLEISDRTDSRRITAHMVLRQCMRAWWISMVACQSRCMFTHPLRHRKNRFFVVIIPFRFATRLFPYRPPVRICSILKL
jgi:hypothetical protein